MKKINFLIISIFLLCSPIVHANTEEIPIKCLVDFHAFANYKDGSGKAVDRKNKKFSMNYDFKKVVFEEIEHEGFILGALAGLIRDPSDSLGEGKWFHGMSAAILNLSTDAKIETTTSLAENRIHLTYMKANQPPNAENPEEVMRDLFWSITCRWKSE